MTRLIKAEKTFLKRHQINERDVFDGTGLSRSQVRVIMKCEGNEFYLGVRCKKANHRIRTRAGHCVQCDTSKVAFMKRHGAIGDVYVAEAPDVGLVKVGSAGDANVCMKALNGYQYAGSRNWKLKAIKKRIQNSGEIEFSAHKLLATYQAEAVYSKDGSQHDCKEVFSCRWQIAAKALQQAATAH